MAGRYSIQPFNTDGLAPRQSPVLTGVVTLPAGTVAAPGTVLPGSTATGWFQPAADTLGITIAGAERLRAGAGAVSLAGAPGAEALRVACADNLVNRLHVAGGPAGGDVVLSVHGADSNRNLIISTGGSGNVQIGSNIGSGANPSRKLQVQAGNATQAAVCLQAYGVGASYFAGFDWIAANGTLLGAVYHEADAAYPLSVASSAGIALKTGGGWVGGGTEQVRVVHTANAVNLLQLSGGASAGAAPAVSAIGSDSNIDLTLSPKGTGVLALGYDGGAATNPGAFSADRYLPVKIGGTTAYIPYRTTSW